jgi:hypothetical protein
MLSVHLPPGRRRVLQAIGIAASERVAAEPRGLAMPADATRAGRAPVTRRSPGASAQDLATEPQEISTC